MVGRVKLTEVITGEKIRAGDVIIGLRSGGKTSYEKQENSGLMCNGITLARHCLMKAMYAQKYPEITDPGSKGYYGRFATDEYLDELGMAVGEAIISPTRIFAPVVFKILDRHANDVTAMINNTGGGLTKCLRVGTNIQYIKDNLIEPDPIFSLIQKESGASWQEMMQDYNMGTGFEIITKKEAVDDILGIAESFKLGAQVIGRCEKGYDKNKLIIRSEFGNCEFSA
jgi:phosphoribosylformylglycinamidine cyclo-ligase